MPDCTAWVALYDALAGEQWPEPWRQSCAGGDIRTDPCSCQGTWTFNVVCSAVRDYAHITEIYLLSDQIEGALPAAFTEFQELNSLSIVGTQMHGSLPEDMGRMASLSKIWLDHNPRLGGAVPHSLTQLNLSVLELHHCGFEHIPALAFRSIPDCTLGYNRFACPLPRDAEVCGAICA